MNFSYDFEGQPPDFQGDSFCDDTDGNWDSVDYGEKLLFCFFDFELFIGTSICVLTKSFDSGDGYGEGFGGEDYGDLGDPGDAEWPDPVAMHDPSMSLPYG